MDFFIKAKILFQDTGCCSLLTSHMRTWLKDCPMIRNTCQITHLNSLKVLKNKGKCPFDSKASTGSSRSVLYLLRHTRKIYALCVFFIAQKIYARTQHSRIPAQGATSVCSFRKDWAVPAVFASRIHQALEPSGAHSEYCCSTSLASSSGVKLYVML